MEKTYELFHYPCVCVCMCNVLQRTLGGENVKAKKFGHACQKLEKPGAHVCRKSRGDLNGIFCYNHDANLIYETEV